ncbi:helix-turn-helix domain-containing protein [Nonomuraea sp. MTCD27]|uniref:helix-turn-helix domain-containing protein n=1 Tax=Nonomuraea sp. MTCD27 TaxID=1676747 RepID=UPI0035C01316
MSNTDTDTRERRYTRQQAADFCQVHHQTITRWANAGKLPTVRTPGGHRRYRESDLVAVMEGEAS